MALSGRVQRARTDAIDPTRKLTYAALIIRAIVEVEVRQGVVTILGRVNTFYERQLCISCCQRVAGVINMNDKVEVAQPHAPTTRSTSYQRRIALAG